jgi:hypothetical protein
MFLNLDFEGQMIWEPGVVMQTICEVDIAKYPFDYKTFSKDNIDIGKIVDMI